MCETIFYPHLHIFQPNFKLKGLPFPKLKNTMKRNQARTNNRRCLIWIRLISYTRNLFTIFLMNVLLSALNISKKSYVLREKYKVK